MKTRKYEGRFLVKSERHPDAVYAVINYGSKRTYDVALENKSGEIIREMTVPIRQMPDFCQEYKYDKNGIWRVSRNKRLEGGVK